MIRENDLVWSFHVMNYLMGKQAAGLRPAVLELGLHAAAGGDAAVVPREDLHRERAAQAGASVARRHADRHLAGSRRPASCLRPRRITSRPGRSVYPTARLLGGEVPLRAGRLGPYRRGDQPAGRPRRNTASGHATTIRTPPRSGSAARALPKARGGRSGPTGWKRGTARSKWRRAIRAIATSR